MQSKFNMDGTMEACLQQLQCCRDHNTSWLRPQLSSATIKNYSCSVVANTLHLWSQPHDDCNP